MIKNKKKEAIYFIYPRWKIIQLKLTNLQYDKLSKKDKKEIMQIKEKIETQLKRNRNLGIATLIIYTMLYFSAISFILSFSEVFTLFKNIISTIINMVGTPILIIVAYLLNRNMTNRYDDIHISMAKIIAKIENKKNK